MSVEALSWALNQAKVEDSGAALVLVALANHAGPDGRDCWPSVERLAYYTRMADRSVRRHLRKLEEDGVIARDDDTRGRDAKTRADQRPNAYRLLMDGPKRDDFETVRDRARAERQKGNGGTDCPPVPEDVTGGQDVRADTVSGGTDTTPRGDTVSPEPSVEPSPLSPPTSERAAPAKDGRKTRMPEGWKPDEKLTAWTRETTSGRLPARELDAFRAYHEAHGSRFVSWDRAWQTWVYRWLDRQGARGGRSQPYRDQRVAPPAQDRPQTGPPASDGWDDYLNPGGQAK